MTASSDGAGFAMAPGEVRPLFPSAVPKRQENRLASRPAIDPVVPESKNEPIGRRGGRTDPMEETREWLLHPTPWT